MKIGVITFLRAYNFGVLLQAYAPREFLLEQNLCAKFIDYMHSTHANCYRAFKFPKFDHKNILRNWRLPFKTLFNIIGIIPHLRNKLFFNRFLTEYMQPEKRLLYSGKKRPPQNAFDILIAGSDQIWSAHCAGLTDLDPICFLQGFSEKSKRISYASSGDILYTPKQLDLIYDTLRSFSHVGVREHEMKNFLCKAGIPAVQVVDPVFLLTAEHWKNLLPPPPRRRRKTVFVYDINNSRDTRILARNIASKINAEIILMAGYDPTPAQLFLSQAGGPQEFLSNLFYADFIVTNSFHALAFSLIFQKQFLINGVRKNAQRQKSLLQALGLEGRYCTTMTDFDTPPIDYATTTLRLNELIKQSQTFLLNALKN